MSSDLSDAAGASSPALDSARRESSTSPGFGPVLTGLALGATATATAVAGGLLIVSALFHTSLGSLA